jgi:hypothetical protein
MPGLGEVRQAFFPYSAERDILALPPPAKAGAASREAAWEQQLTSDAQACAGRILGLTESGLSAACGADLTVQASRRAAMCLRLRACWQCMKLGFHSVLFQHFALRRCPLHGTALSTKCPKCEAELRPSFMSVSRDPFTCANCGGLWLRTVRPAWGDLDLSLVGAMLAGRRRDLRPVVATGRETVHIEQIDPSPLQISSYGLDSERYGRHVARAVVWPSDPSPRWPSFLERRQTLDDWSDRPAVGWAEGGPLTRRAATDCLLTLARLVGRQGHSEHSQMLRSRLSLQPRGLRINETATIASIALHRTMCAYARCVAFKLDPVWPTESRSSVYDDVEWNRMQVGRRLLNSDAGNAELIRAEILGWFAACIIDSASLNYLHNVEWLSELPKTLFLPTWVISQNGRTRCLRLRARVSDATIRGLLGRYSTDHCLHKGSWEPLACERRYVTPQNQLVRLLIRRGYFPEMPGAPEAQSRQVTTDSA